MLISIQAARYRRQWYVQQRSPFPLKPDRATDPNPKKSSCATGPVLNRLHLTSPGVGKSSLLLRFDEDKFTPNFISTIGFVFFCPVLG
jgi:hypothetical protein